MKIDSNGKPPSTPYEKKLTYEEKIEHEHSELMRVIKPWLRSNPMEYELYLCTYENHDIIRAKYRLYALTCVGYFPNAERKHARFPTYTSTSETLRWRKLIGMISRNTVITVTKYYIGVTD